MTKLRRMMLERKQVNHTVP